jgi:hypothetical protein
MTKTLIQTPANPDGIMVDMTAEEISQCEVNFQKGEDEKAQKIADAENKATLKASAKAKLIAGEALTEAEADTIVL